MNSFLPNLVASTAINGQIRAAFGYRDTTRGPLFLECYLDQPVERMLSDRLGDTVKRRQIVEVGNLSIAKPGHSMTTMRDIARFLQGLGYEWIVCTATRYLRILFIKSGSKPIPIAQACVSGVVDDGTDWGNYYVTAPEILAGNISESISLIETKLRSRQHIPDFRQNLNCSVAR